MANTAAIVLGVILGLIVLTFIILIATGYIHFGRTSTTPTQAQLIAALRSGLTITATDAATNTNYQSIVTLRNENTPGISMSIASSARVGTVSAADVGGDSLSYRFVPSAGPQVGTLVPGVNYEIKKTSAPIRTVAVDNKMVVTQTPPVVFTTLPAGVVLQPSTSNAIYDGSSGMFVSGTMPTSYNPLEYGPVSQSGITSSAMNSNLTYQTIKTSSTPYRTAQSGKRSYQGC